MGGRRATALPRLLYRDQESKPRGKQCVLKYDPEPKVLGLVYDERLTFEPHVKQLREKVQKRANVRNALSGTSWGGSRETARVVHLSYVQSRLEYALPAFAPYVTKTNAAELAKEQYKAACHVSGCPKGTRREVAFEEAGLQPLQQRIEYTAAVEYERYRRLPEGNRAKAAAERQTPAPVNAKGAHAAGDATRVRNWRELARRVLKEAELEGLEREPLRTHARIPPWEVPDFVDFRPQLVRPVTRKDPPEERRSAALETLRLLPQADVEAYTDGSVLNPRKLGRGGGGYVAETYGGNSQTGRCAAGTRCTSYRAELTALRKLCEDMERGWDDDDMMFTVPPDVDLGHRDCEIRICLDSQSAITALSRGATEQTGDLEQQVWDGLIKVHRKHNAHVTIQYVPGHVDLEEQEKSDVVAKEASAKCEQKGTAIPLSIVSAAVRSRQREQLRKAIPEGHLWLRSTGGKEPKYRGIPRVLQRMLSQLRAGRCPATGAIMYRFGSRVKVLECPADGKAGLTCNATAHVAEVAKGSAAEEAGITT
eukprot:gene57845-biopygen85912